MIKLPKTYRKNGYEFHEVKREGDVAIYRQVDIDSGQPIAFEVFEVIKNKEREFAGTLMPERESCPSNEQWGQKGYTVWTILEAEEKAAILQGRISERSLAKTQQRRIEISGMMLQGGNPEPSVATEDAQSGGR